MRMTTAICIGGPHHGRLWQDDDSVHSRSKDGYYQFEQGVGHDVCSPGPFYPHYWRWIETTRDKDERITELLKSNNELLARVRAAEDKISMLTPPSDVYIPDKIACCKNGPWRGRKLSTDILVYVVNKVSDFSGETEGVAGFYFLEATKKRIRYEWIDFRTIKDDEETKLLVAENDTLRADNKTYGAEIDRLRARRDELQRENNKLAGAVVRLDNKLARIHSYIDQVFEEESVR